MALIVQKFGGSVLVDRNSFEYVAKSIKNLYETGNRVVVVVSAIKGKTDRLINVANKLYKNCTKEFYRIVTSAEYESCILLKLALNRLGVNVTVKSGYNIGINLLNGGIDVNTYEYVSAIKNSVVVVGGFHALDCNKNIVMFERGGSDLTAVVLAHYLGADYCQLIKDVDGIYSENPKIYTNASCFKNITYNNLIYLCGNDCKIVQKQALLFAERHNLTFYVSDINGYGTIVAKDFQKPCLCAENLSKMMCKTA